MQLSYGNQALILRAWGRLDEALALHKKEEAICLELGDKDSLQRSYGNQALILKPGGSSTRLSPCTRKKKQSAWSWVSRTDCSAATATRRSSSSTRATSRGAGSIPKEAKPSASNSALKRRSWLLLLAVGRTGRSRGRPLSPQAEAPAGPRPLHRTQHAPPARHRPGRARPTPLRQNVIPKSQSRLRDARRKPSASALGKFVIQIRSRFQPATLFREGASSSVFAAATTTPQNKNSTTLSPSSPNSTCPASATKSRPRSTNSPPAKRNPNPSPACGTPAKKAQRFSAGKARYKNQEPVSTGDTLPRGREPARQLPQCRTPLVFERPQVWVSFNEILAPGRAKKSPKNVLSPPACVYRLTN